MHYLMVLKDSLLPPLSEEDGSQAKVDEKLEFKVIEFNKAAKRIIVSHSRVFEDAQKSETKKNAEEEIY